VEENLVMTTQMAERYSSEGERGRQQEDILEKLREGWESQTIGERQELLKEALARIVVSDDGVDLVLRT
jgi:hypothetical protein